MLARLQSEVGTKYFLRKFCTKTARNFPEILMTFACCGSEKIRKTLPKFLQDFPAENNKNHRRASVGAQGEIVSLFSIAGHGTGRGLGHMREWRLLQDQKCEGSERSVSERGWGE